MTYAVYVDWRDDVWVSDFGNNALLRFEPDTAQFETFPLPANPGNVRQILGREREIWGAESAADRLIVVRYVEAP
jgi:virginiamycin B lyase